MKGGWQQQRFINVARREKLLYLHGGAAAHVQKGQANAEGRERLHFGRQRRLQRGGEVCANDNRLRHPPAAGPALKSRARAGQCRRQISRALWRKGRGRQRCEKGLVVVVGGRVQGHENLGARPCQHQGQANCLRADKDLADHIADKAQLRGGLRPRARRCGIQDDDNVALAGALCSAQCRRAHLCDGRARIVRVGARNDRGIALVGQHRQLKRHRGPVVGRHFRAKEAGDAHLARTDALVVKHDGGERHPQGGGADWRAQADAAAKARGVARRVEAERRLHHERLRDGGLEKVAGSHAAYQHLALRQAKAVVRVARVEQRKHTQLREGQRRRAFALLQLQGRRLDAAVGRVARRRRFKAREKQREAKARAREEVGVGSADDAVAVGVHHLQLLRRQFWGIACVLRQQVVVHKAGVGQIEAAVKVGVAQRPRASVAGGAGGAGAGGRLPALPRGVAAAPPRRLGLVPA